MFQHLFALVSKHKGVDRTYYLAAESDSEMTKWVECLCNVCGCKPVANTDEGTYCGRGWAKVGGLAEEIVERREGEIDCRQPKQTAFTSGVVLPRNFRL